ncbi:uncharacterized protein LOC122503961 [Leptopilina heterotoma]|uniref:uncharacterized protein LOC122503961 n=1 Tax=Leptopilina heterotoma TaxID=63436 RepID=UPI001CA7C629|nr:uncharacterized protein LOC122503961 [Leptopilina heterotoma]
MESNSERLADLLTGHKALEQEELFLTNLLSKIDKQIHALQVEQLNIINAKNQTETNPMNRNDNTITGDVPQVPEDKTEKESSNENRLELDLRPIKRYIDSEEDEEEDDFENNEFEFPNNSADFDYL